MRLPRRLVLPALFIAPVGCHATMVLPSTRVAAVTETPETVGAGRHALSVSSAGVAPAVLFRAAARVQSQALTYTYGLGAGSDLAIAPIVQAYGDGREHVVDFRAEDGFGVGIDARYKFRPFELPYVAAYVGAGGLATRYGSFGSASLGVTAGFPIPYAMVFVNVHGYAAEPVSSAPIALKDHQVLRATTTVGVLGAVGVSAKATEHLELRFACPTVGYAASRSHDTTVFGVGISAHYTF